jgi:hypothetical protein
MRSMRREPDHPYGRHAPTSDDLPARSRRATRGCLYAAAARIITSFGVQPVMRASRDRRQLGERAASFGQEIIHAPSVVHAHVVVA